MSHLAVFQDGILAAKAGKKMIARLQFEQAAELNPNFIHSWLWLAWTADSPQQAADFLAKAEELDPSNQLISSYRQVVSAFDNYDIDNDYSSFLSTSEANATSSTDTEQFHPEAETQTETEPQSNVEPSGNKGVSDTRSFDEIQREIADEKKSAEAHTEASESADEASSKLSDEPSTEKAPSVQADIFDESNWDDTSESKTSAAVAEPVEPVSTIAPQDEVTPSDTPTIVAKETDTEPDDHVDLSANDETQLAADVNELNEDVQSTIAAVPSSNSPPASQPEEPRNDIPTILAVDDSPTVRKLVTMTLKSGGYNVETAEDGVEAMKMLANFTPSLILLDVNMPRMDGYKLCKLIKRHEKTKFIPVVMLSGKDGMFDKLRGTLVGCDDYISKPFRSTDLLSHIEKYVLAPSV